MRGKGHTATSVAMIFLLSVLFALFRSSWSFSPSRIHSHSQASKLVARSRPFALRSARISNTLQTTTTALRFKVTEGDDDDEGFDEDVDFDDFTKPTSPTKRISKSIVPLAASIGFVATPSSRLAVKVGGALAGGVVGLVTKVAVVDKLVKEEEERELKIGMGDDDDGGDGNRVSTEVTNLMKRLKDGPPLNSYTLKKLESVARKASIPGNLLAELFTHVFSEVVLMIVQTDSSDVTELEEAMAFADVMELTDYEIKDGLTIAAIKLGKQLKKEKSGFYQSVLPKDFLLHGAKLFFLSNKFMGTSQGYYGKRMSVAMVYLPDEMMKDAMTDACTKLFIRCVDSVLANPSDFSQEEIASFMEFLTVTSDISDLRPATMQDMIMSALTQSLDSSLGENAVENAMEVSVSNYQNLQTTREVFGWESLEFDKTVETKTMPVFEAAAKQIVEKCVDNPENAEELKKSLHERMESLNIDKKKARIMLHTKISDSNKHYMSEIDHVYNMSGGALEPTFKMMAAYCTTHDGLKILVSDLMESSAVPLPGLPFADMVKVSMFEMQQVRKDSRITDEMFALNEDQREIVLKNMVLPKVASWITQCISEENFSPDAKAAYEKLLKEKNIEDQQWAATAIDFYYQEIEKMAKMSAIPSSVDMDRAKRLKEFLGCSETLVAKVNLELLGDKYMKAVTESMMPSGVIQPEYIEGLERLRNRLGISQADSEKLLGVTTRSRVGEVTKNLIEQWKADTGAIERKDSAQKKDKSGDPIDSQDSILGYMETGANVMETGGPNVFMREALNLVDHVVENYQASQNIDLNETNDMPVTAVGYASEEELFEIYKHYIVTRLMEKDAELKARYTKDEDFFARILGLSPNDQAKCKETFLYSAYKRMLKQAFQFKDSIDANDLQQFAFLKDSLSMEKDTCDRILKEASKGAVIEYTASIMRPKDNLITADVARKLRGQMSTLNLDIREDIGLNPNVIGFMYTLEVQAAIEGEYEGELQELQESYGIPEETAAYIVDVASKRYISQLLSIGLSHARKYDEAQTNSITEKIVKFMHFFDGPVDADANLFSEDDKERLINFYRDDERSKRSVEQKREDCVRLKELILLSEDFVAPIEGIAGLKGEAKTDRSATGMMM